MTNFVLFLSFSRQYNKKASFFIGVKILPLSHKTIALTLLLSLSFSPLSKAQNITLEPSSPGSLQILSEHPRHVSRGEAVSTIVQAFRLRQKEASFLQTCLDHKDECFFTFSARSRFDHLQLDPLTLYPDIPVAYRYADDVNIASMLDLVQGYIDEKNSPFYPRAYMRRIDALKVVLGAAGLLKWQERFEMVKELGSENALFQQRTAYDDVSGAAVDRWWYPRYVNFAYTAHIIPATQKFRPDDAITDAELQSMIDHAQLKLTTMQNNEPHPESA